MTTNRYEKAKDIFLEACNQPPEERSRFLSQACGGDDELRREVEILLAHDPSSDFEKADDEPASSPGSIEKYRFIRRIGCGGMGDVWEAEQLSPVRRRVALKLIRSGIIGSGALARFEAERQALALMNHPNIATVFEAGTTDEGRPYFAMELVEGLPITEYCDRQQLSLNERLALFVQVCDGVQHAHQKGVIHRDLKPSNVLVADEEGRPTPKIIDFGVAKATSLRLTENTFVTEQGQWLGTPEYMSPEQAGLTDVDVDTRTDVYALGVLLYELLVGTQPFDADTLRSAGFGEMCRILREEDPPRPSTRVSTLGERSDTIARQRRTSGPALSRMLRGDLDWIVIRALEKDRNRRYDSAAAFAADIHRFLDNESVHARPPSAAYRLRKYVARNRIAVTAGLVVIASLITATIGTTVGMVRARRDAEATRRVAESMAVVFETLNPAASAGHLQSARKALSLAAEEVESQLEDQPLLHGRLMMTMAQTYMSLGDYHRAAEGLEEALALWRAELGDNDPSLGELYLWLGGSQSQLGDFDAARASFERAVEIHQLNLGPDHVSTGWALASLGNCLCRIGEYERSRSLLDRSEQILTKADGPDSDYVAGVLEFKGLLFIFLGEHESAKEVLERSVANHQRWLGRDHTGVAGSLMLLAIANSWLGDLDLAEEQLRRALEINQRAFGHDHAAVAVPLRELGRIASARGNLEAARSLIERALEIEEASLGLFHPDLVWTLRARGIVLRRMGEVDSARATLERALDIVEVAYGSVHFEGAVVHHALGSLEYDAGGLDLALGHFERAGEILRKTVPPRHRMTGLNCYQRACIVARLGGRGEAIDLLWRMLETDFVDDTIFEDTDLDGLRGDADFEAIQNEMRRRFDG